MSGWLKAIFDSIGGVVVRWVTGIFNLLRSFVWMWVSLLLAILAPISWAIDWWARSAAFMYEQTLNVYQSTTAINVGSAGTHWGALAGGAALMNCVVALDYAIATGSVVLGIWIMLAIARALVWIYKLIPFKAS